MNDADVWALVERYRRSLMRICARYANDPIEADEIFSDIVVARALSIMRTYDPLKGNTPHGHLHVNVKWYAYKWREKRNRRQPVESLNPRAAYVVDKDAELDAGTILARLDPVDADILRWIAMDGFTWREVSDHTGLSVPDVKRRYESAKQKAAMGGE